MQAVTKCFSSDWRNRCASDRARKERAAWKKIAHRRLRVVGRRLARGDDSAEMIPVTGYDVC